MRRLWWVALAVGCKEPAPPSGGPAAGSATGAASVTASASVTPSASASASVVAADAGIGAASGSPSASSPVASKPRCMDGRTLVVGGLPHSCYPYRCVVDRCLEKCASPEKDCAPYAAPGQDLATYGWPLECIGSKCVPMNPEKVKKGSP